MFSNLLPELGHYSVFIGFQLKDKFDVVIRKSGCDVHVKMKHGLAGDSTVVGEDIEAIQIQTPDYRPGDYLGYVKNIVQVALRYRQEIAAVYFWDDESVPIVNRVDIENRDYPIILVENFSGSLALNNLTENTMHGTQKLQEQRSIFCGWGMKWARCCCSTYCLTPEL